jgi:hypothetical protein
LKAFDVETGRELWKLPLGTVQKAPLVLADGKLYVGTESGKFFIVRPGADKAEVLSEGVLPLSNNSVQQAEGTPEPILVSAAVSRGRVFSSRATRSTPSDRGPRRRRADSRWTRRSRRAMVRRRGCRSRPPRWS